MFSLVCIAYKFVYKQLPWEKIEEVKQDLTFLNTALFATIRHTRNDEFIQELLTEKSEFQPLFKLLIDTERQQQLD